MQPFFSDQKVEWEHLPSIFLAGPTPRTQEVITWRIEALRILNIMKYPGLVLVPERHNWQTKFYYHDQVEWELEGLRRCSCVAFWIPRDLKTLPGFTTNVEFGFLVGDPGQRHRVVYGRPDISHKNRYLDWLYNKCTGESPYRTLEDTLANAIIISSKNSWTKG